MEAIIGTIIGAIIAGLAMILNSHYSAKRQEIHEDHQTRRDQLSKDIDNLSQLYQDALQMLDRTIRKRGTDREDKLQELYNTEIKLQLEGTSEIHSKFLDVKNTIADMAKKLPSLPEEFVPKFEDDHDRFQRLEARKEAEEEREVEAKKYLGDVFKLHNELAELMKDDLESRKKLEP